MFRATRIDWSTVTSATERTIAAFSSTGGDHAGLFHSRRRAGVAFYERGVVLPSCSPLSFFLSDAPDNLHCRISLRIMGV